MPQYPPIPFTFNSSTSPLSSAGAALAAGPFPLRQTWVRGCPRVVGRCLHRPRRRRTATVVAAAATVAALPEPQSSQILRHACAQPAAQSPGDARTCASSYGGAVGTFVKKYVFGENTPFTNTSRACVEERTQELSGAAERAGGAWVSGLHIYTQSSTVRYSLPRSERRGNETAAECSTARRARSWLVRSGPCSAGSFGSVRASLGQVIAASSLPPVAGFASSRFRRLSRLIAAASCRVPPQHPHALRRRWWSLLPCGIPWCQ